MKNLLFALCIVSALVMTGCRHHDKHHRDNRHNNPPPAPKHHVDQHHNKPQLDKHGKPVAKPAPAPVQKGKLPPPPKH